MKKALEAHFGEYYGSPKKVSANCSMGNGRFVLADAKACRDCGTHTPDYESQCDKAVAVVDSGGTWGKKRKRLRRNMLF